MNRATDYPYWAYKTKRDFKQQKRKDLRQLIRALNQYRLGCAFTGDAACNAFDRINKDIEIIKKAIAVKEWGR